MGTRTDNTLAEVVSKMQKDIAEYMLQASDEEIPLCEELISTFMSIARRPLDDMAAQGMTQAPPSAARTALPGVGTPPGVPGLSSMPMTDPGELSRMFGSQPGANVG